MTEESVVPPAAEPPEPPGGAGAWLFGALIGLVVLGLIIAAWVAGKDEGKRQARSSGATAVAVKRTTTKSATPSPAVAAAGRKLFTAKCAACHTLSDAGTKGTVGPNLDQLKPGAAQVLSALKAGGTGSGGMPQGLYQGAQAQQVAAYVASAAGGG